MNAKTTTYWRRSLQGRYLTGALIGALSLSAQATTLSDQLIGATREFLELSVSDYLQRSSISGRHEIEIKRIDPRLRLPTCDNDLTVTLESPSEPVGRVTMRVRCDSTARWTVFVPGEVHLYRDVVIAQRPLKRRAVLSSADIALAERDIGSLNQGYLTSLNQALGKKLTRTLRPDQVLTPATIELAEAVRRGDQVTITASSGGIQVRMPGEALSDGAVGRQINVRNVRSSRVVKARVTGPGQVEVNM
ncbi:flagellar basal body P-ring formation chaperone FlgA [Pseudomonas marincola]|uniref:flagellar basal body P-ring formation chaperone FlgA n=1 Tax=Pseudomonas marincola TaxID=437900 RepID=UPI000A45491A|nr:flagellar basal body P-ring formation chaperone FlgA [Pseudomonas marincola]